jgi:hypothetical protein
MERAVSKLVSKEWPSLVVARCGKSFGALESRGDYGEAKNDTDFFFIDNTLFEDAGGRTSI